MAEKKKDERRAIIYRATKERRRFLKMETIELRGGIQRYLDKLIDEKMGK